MKSEYTFTSKLYLYNGGRENAAWHFITLPLEIADEINFIYADKKRGWGSLKVDVRIGESNWTTSIFPQREHKSFFLPVKAEVRKKESIKDGDNVEVSIKIK